MATTENFSFLTLLDNSFTTSGSSITQAYTLSDNADGSSDGSTSIGSLMRADGPGGTHLFTLLGTTANGVVFEFNSQYWLASNSTYSNSQALTVDTSSAYTYCFMQGTQIQTPNGERSVETDIPHQIQE